MRTYYLNLTFWLTFISYVGFHSARKSFTNTKVKLEQSWHWHTDFLGLLDTCFMFSYAFGSYIVGYLLAKYQRPKLFLIVALFACAVTTLLFSQANSLAFTALFVYHELLIMLMIINGFFQAFGWTCAISVLEEYYKNHERISDHNNFQEIKPLLFNYWSFNIPIGNITGSLIVVACLEANFNTNWFFFLPAFLLIFIAIILYFFLPNFPLKNKLDDSNTLVIKLIQDELTANKLSTNELLKTNKSSKIKPAEICKSMETRKSIEAVGEKMLNNSDVILSPISSVRLSSDSTNSNSNCYGSVDLSSPTPTLSPLFVSVSIDHENNSEGELDQNVDHIGNEFDKKSTCDLPWKEIPVEKKFYVINIVLCGIVYMFTKFVQYSCFFWLPFYLNKKLNYSESQSGLLSNLFDVGQILGILFSGYIVTKFKNLNSCGIYFLTLLIMLIGSTISTFSLFISNTILYQNIYLICFIILLCGGTVGGSSNFIISSIVVNLSESSTNQSSSQSSVNKSLNSISSISAFMDGTGSLGAAAGGLLISYLQNHFDWSVVFLVWTICMILSIFSLIIIRKSIK